MTFRELGVPFALFEARVESAAGYAGLGTCSLCERRNVPCFRLEIGADVIVPCPRCNAETPLDAADRTAAACLACGSSIAFPETPSDLLGCAFCLREGRIALTKDTQLGMIRYVDALAGVTHGRPGLNHPDFELVPLSDDWIGARLPADAMHELLRTPGYSTWQGDNWLFCCGRPMVYRGEWREVESNEPSLRELIAEHLGPDAMSASKDTALGVYIFRCPSCERRAAHSDAA